MNSWELRELEGLPAIAALEAQQAELAGKLADGSLYRDAPAEVERINGELAKLESELEEIRPLGAAGSAARKRALTTARCMKKPCLYI